MYCIKTFETFNINKYIDDMNKYDIINIDPFEEEDWDELENGDIIFYINKYNNINFEKYDGTQDIILKFKKLSKNNILKELLKNRNRKIIKNKIRLENIFRKINKIKKESNEKLKQIFKNGKVEQGRNITLKDIKSGKINEFIFYEIFNDGENLIINKYLAINMFKENNDWDFWDEIEKNKNEKNFKLKKQTYNRCGESETFGLNIYYSELEKKVNNGDILLESKNIKKEISDIYIKLTNFNINKYLNDINKIKKELIIIDKSLEDKIKSIEKRFPNLF